MQPDAWENLYTLRLDQPLPSGFDNATADNIHAVMTFGLVKTVLWEGLDKNDTQEAYLELWEEAVEHIEELPDSDPRQSHYLADLYMSRALLHFREGNTLRGGWQIRKAIRLLTSLSEEFPRYYDHLPLYGLLQGALETVPDQYQWALPTLGITVEKKGARSIMLEGLSRAGYHHRLKGEYLTALADMYLFNNPGESLDRLEILLYKKSNHNLAHHMLVMLYLRDFQADNALIHTQKLEKQYPEKSHPLPSVHYMKGEALLRKGLYDDAIRSFDRFLQLNKGQHLVKDVYFKQGLAWYLMGERGQSEVAFKNAVHKGVAVTDTDKYAQTIASGEEELPVPYLVEARLRTDGGYLDEAIAILTADRNISSGDTAYETTYRLARVYHLKRDTAQAVALYKKTIEMGTGNKYFAPNACLQAGYLLAEQEPEIARMLFRRAIGYQDHPYESGIEQKAKAALKELP
ncbi:MAG: hypothetical protein WBB45_06815 [Cyclobacteriaceae bacterium]